MKKTRTRLWSLLLTVAMLLTLLPATALAGEGDVAQIVGQEGGYKTLQEAINAATSGQTVELLQNVTVAETIEIDEDLTIDLNGCTITGQNEEAGRRVFHVIAGILTLTGEGTVTTADKNGSGFTEGSSVIRVGKDSSGDAGLVVEEDVTITAPASYGVSIFAYTSEATLTLDVHGRITSTNAGAIGNNGSKGCAVTKMNIHPSAVLTSGKDTAIYHPGRGTITIDGAEITGYNSGIGIKSGTMVIKNGAKISCVGPNEAPTDGYSNGINASGAAIQIESNKSYYGNMVITIDDATVVSTNGYAIYEYANKTDDADDALRVKSLDITSGTFAGGSDVDGQVFAVSSVTDMTGIISITGGEFSSDVSKYIAPGYVCNSSGESYIVEPLGRENATAMVDGDSGVAYFETLKEAITAAKGGETVELLKNVTENVIIPEDADITLDLGTYTLTNESSHTIVNNGTLTIIGSGTVDNVTHAKAALYNYGTMTIEGGTFTRSKEVQCTSSNNYKTTNSWYAVVNAGTMTINDGTFTTGDGTSETLGNFSSLIRNGNDDKSVENGILTITGGTFLSGANIIKNEEGSVIESISGGTFTMDNSKIQWYGGNNMLQSYGTIKSITGGTFQALGTGVSVDNNLNYFRHGIGVYDDGKIENVGGSVSFYMEGTQNRLIRSGSITITGGTYTLKEEEPQNNIFFYTDEGGTVSITGGTFSSDPKDYVDEGYGVLEENGTYRVGVLVTVDFVNDGTTVKTVKALSGDRVSAPADPVKEGYTFLGWYNGSTKFNANNPVTESGTYTAQWAIKTYTVTYAVDGVEQEDTVSHGAKITYVPDKEGYAFAGWYVDETMTESWDMETDVVTSDITLYAKWNEVVTPDDQPAGVDEIQVAPSAPVIEGSSDPDAQDVIDALKEGVEQKGVTDAAKNLASDSDYMASVAAEAKVELGTEENVTLVVETSLNISVTDVNDGDSFTLDITPTYTITATADGKTTTIVKDEPLTVTKSVTLTIPLPESFADAAKLFVHHLKNNRTYVYDGEVAGDKLTFTNPHGFSQFTISRTGPEASVDGVQYATLQEAVDAVENRGTVTVHQSGLYAQVSGVKTFWVETDTGVEMPLLYAAPGYTLSKDGNKYTVRVRTIDDPDNDYELPTWDITVEDSDNGDVEVSPEEAKPTTTITITVTPDKGYAVAEVVVTAENGKEITVTDKGNGKYTFSMPNSDVTIEVTFQPVSGGAAGSDLTITAPTGWVNPFTDVAANAWYYDAVGYANANGLMGGTSATTFAPNGAMNRSMVWTVIARLAGQTISGANWAEDAKAWAVAQGVSDGTNPDGSVTREELVTMLYRYIGSPVMNVPELGLINSYPDAASVSDWAQDAFAWALSRGIIDGRDGKLASGESVTRAEAATILARFHLLTK